MRNVYVVICPELGWDCVVNVFDEKLISKKTLLEHYPESDYVIQLHKIHITVEE